MGFHRQQPTSSDASIAAATAKKPEQCNHLIWFIWTVAVFCATLLQWHLCILVHQLCVTLTFRSVSASDKGCCLQKCVPLWISWSLRCHAVLLCASCTDRKVLLPIEFPPFGDGWGVVKLAQKFFLQRSALSPLGGQGGRSTLLQRWGGSNPIM